MAKILGAKTVSARARRGRTFLRVLSASGSVTAACKASELGWATLYRWRRKDAAFRAAWDEALAVGDEARIARLDDEMMRRAVDGFDDPVFHKGEAVAARKRYSDSLLMFAIRELRDRRRSEKEGSERRAAERPPATPSADSKITVVVRQFGPVLETTGAGATKETADE